MSVGLSESELKLVQGALRKCAGLRRAVIFGSRAKGNAKAASDVDIAVWGLTDGRDVARLALELDDLPLPYKFDVVGFESIQNPDLKAHVERVGVPLFEA